jgi:Mrp family chromosome partitioning ATPase
MEWRDGNAPRSARSRKLDFGSACEAVAARKWRLIVAPLAALILFGVFLALQTPRYGAEARVLIGPPATGLIGLRSNLALLDGVGGFDAASGQAQLIASRDLARRAILDLGIQNNPEFDPVLKGVGPISRALVFFGLMRDPARKSPEDRVLEAYQNRLRVSAQNRASVVTIAFQSEDRDLAANAVNRIAELYLEMRQTAKLAKGMPRQADARIISRAVAPEPLYPDKGLLLLSGAAMFLMASGAVAIALPRARQRRLAQLPVEQPRAVGQVRVFVRLNDLPRLNPQIYEKSGPPQGVPDEVEGDEADDGHTTTKIATRILSVPFAGRGVRIVVTSLKAAGGASQMMVGLARDLEREGRSIVVGLDQGNLLDFWIGIAGAPIGNLAPSDDEPGLSDLLAGVASFADVIRRDPASRLHFLPIGRHEGLDLDEFGGALEALAETYDFILLIAPPLDESEIAMTLAAKADFVVLATPAQPNDGAAYEAEAALMESGAREVLLVGLPAESPQSLGRNAA